MLKAAYWTMGALSLIIAAIQLRFLFLPLPLASPDMVHHVADIAPVFWVHVIAAAWAMAAGVPQFLVRLRTAYPRIHRWTGRTYVAAVLLGGLSGLGLALNANGGFVTQSGFSLLAVCWLIATGMALRHVLAGRYVDDPVLRADLRGGDAAVAGADLGQPSGHGLYRGAADHRLGLLGSEPDRGGMADRAPSGYSGAADGQTRLTRGRSVRGGTGPGLQAGRFP